MHDDFLNQQIRRTNRNLLLVGALFLGALALVLVACRRELKNLALGPFPVSPADLVGLGAPDAAGRYFVRVRSDQELFTGLNEYPKQVGADNSRVVARYVAIPAAERFLLVRVEPPDPRAEYTGSLVPLPSSLIAALAKSPRHEISQLQSKSLPVMLDTAQSPRGDWTLLLTVLILFVAAAAALFLALSRILAPGRHPARAALSRQDDPSKAALQLDSELRMERPSQNWRALRLTRNWLVHSAPFSVRVTRMKDLVWTYPRVVKRVYSFVPVERTYGVVIRDRFGQTINVVTKKDVSGPLIAALQRRAPWILAGYSAELEKSWRRDRARLIAIVDQRRAA
ncbi:MAG TPA: DUF6709 family protein, partial [Methylomirabilota bacterium]|nr:DUF6709 family protein [Methylomirabilota bacterium]